MHFEKDLDEQNKPTEPTEPMELTEFTASTESIALDTEVPFRFLPPPNDAGHHPTDSFIWNAGLAHRQYSVKECGEMLDEWQASVTIAQDTNAVRWSQTLEGLTGFVHGINVRMMVEFLAAQRLRGHDVAPREFKNRFSKSFGSPRYYHTMDVLMTVAAEIKPHMQFSEEDRAIVSKCLGQHLFTADGMIALVQAIANMKEPLVSSKLIDSVNKRHPPDGTVVRGTCSHAMVPSHIFHPLELQKRKKIIIPMVMPSQMSTEKDGISLKYKKRKRMVNINGTSYLDYNRSDISCSIFIISRNV